MTKPRKTPAPKAARDTAGFAGHEHRVLPPHMAAHLL